MQFLESVDKLFEITNQTFKDGDRPSWNWICQKLIRLLAEYPDGITETIIKSDLILKWNDITLRDTGSLGKKGMPSSLYFNFRKDVVPNDAVLHLEVRDIELEKNENRIYLLTLGDRNVQSSKTEIKMILPPKFNGMVDDGVLAVGESLILTNVVMNYSNIRAQGTGRGGLALTCMPTENLAFVVHSCQAEANLSSDINADLVLTFQVLSIEPPEKVKSAVKWGNSIPYDKFKEYSEQQNVVCQLITADQEVQLAVRLVFWDNYTHSAKLLLPNDVVRIRGFHFNSEAQVDDHLTLEYLPASVMCILDRDLIKSGPDGSSGGELDVSLASERVMLSVLSRGMTNIDVLVYVVSVENTFGNHYEVGVSQDIQSGETYTIAMINHDDTQPMPVDFEIGDSVYFQGLFTNPMEESEMVTLFFDESLGSSYQGISRLQGVLSSPFLYKEIKLSEAADYVHSVVSGIVKFVHLNTDEPHTHQILITINDPSNLCKLTMYIAIAKLISIFHLPGALPAPDLVTHFDTIYRTKPFTFHLTQINNKYRIDNMLENR